MIKSHIEAIQNEIKERFGVEATVYISVHNVNQEINIKKAEEISSGLQPDFEKESLAGSGENYNWIQIDNYEQGKKLAIFYTKEVQYEPSRELPTNMVTD